jgi:hypothetical protein
VGTIREVGHGSLLLSVKYLLTWGDVSKNGNFRLDLAQSELENPVVRQELLAGVARM